MIFQIVVFILILVFGGLLYYPLRLTVTQTYSFAAQNYPAFVQGVPVEFINAVFYWLPLFILFVAAVWFFVNIQRPTREIYE